VVEEHGQLGQGEPGLVAKRYDGQLRHDTGMVAALPADPGGRAQQPDLLVVAQRRGAQADRRATSPMGSIPWPAAIAASATSQEFS